MENLEHIDNKPKTMADILDGFDKVIVSIKELRDNQAKTDRQIAETGMKIDELGKQVSAVNETVNGISKSNGNVAEEYFENIFATSMTFAGMHFDEIIKRKRYIDPKREDEFDIIMLNSVNAVIIETKYKAREKYIDEVIKKAESFRYWFPERKDNRIFLGLASFRFEENIIGKARKKGIAIIQQLGDKTIVDDKHLKAY